MKTLKIYDPAMCCPTGVCGTNIDTKLVQLANFLNTLDKNMFEGGVFSPLNILIKIHIGLSKSLKLKIVDDYLVNYKK